MEPPVPLDQVRPLPAPARRAGEAVVFELGSREVRLDGNEDLVRSVLDLCDGNATVADIASTVEADGEDVRDLVAALLEGEALVDATEAWKHFHRQSSAESRFHRPPDTRGIALLARPAPPPAAVDESRELSPRTTELRRLAAARRSAFMSGEPRAVAYDELSAVLDAMYGAPRGADAHRPVPSGGALYPLLVQVLVREPVGPLSPGLWWFDPSDDRLRRMEIDPPDPTAVLLSQGIADALVSRGHPIVFVSGDVARAGRKYANRAYRLVLMETGAAMQNAYLVAAEMGLPVRALAGLADRDAERTLGLPEGAVPLLALLLGS